MPSLKIGQKVLIVVGTIAILFTLVLSFVIGASSLDNLRQLKREELARTCDILASRIEEMGRNAMLMMRSLEENEQIVKELQLLTNLGPYYADPGSYFGTDFQGQPIEDAEKIYVFQAQLNLIDMLRATQRVNNLTSVSFYLISPFGVVADAQPALAFRLDQAYISVAQFDTKGDGEDQVFYQVSAEAFAPPAPDYFDISSAYSAPPMQFYVENNFKAIEEPVDDGFPFEDWRKEDAPRSQIALQNNVPVIQTWYPVQIPISHPETWVEESVTAGLALVEQELGFETLLLLKDQLGLDLGFAQGDQLLITSLGGGGILPEPVDLGPDQEVGLGEDTFYFATQNIQLVEARSTDLVLQRTQDLDAVILSPVSELQRLAGRLRLRIGLAAFGIVVLIALGVYLSIRYLVNRPLDALMRGVQQVAAGDWRHKVVVHSQDELGQLAMAFNTMAEQLSELVGGLEEQVASRTQELDRHATELEQRSRESERRAAQLEASTQVAHAVASLLDPEALLNQVVDLISEQFGYYHVGVFLLDDAGRWAVLEAANSEGGQRMLARGHRLQVGAQGIVGDATGTGHPRVALDVGVDAIYFDNPDLPETRSEVALPLIARGQIIGALDVQSTAEDAFDKGDVRVLSALADQIAVALDNARLYSASQKALAQVRAVQQQYLGQAWSDFNTRQGTDFYQYQRTAAKVLTCPGGQCQGSTSKGMDVPLGKGEADATDQMPETERVLQEGVTAVMPGEDGRPEAVVVPIKLRDQIIGALGLEEAKGGYVWDDEAVLLIETVADQVAQAMEAARLLDETQRRAQRERLTSEIAGKIRAAGDIDDVLRITVQEIRRALGARYGVIRLGTETFLRPPEEGDEADERS